MSKLIDITGQQFGRLTVVGRALHPDIRHVRWLCLCVCGAETLAQSTDLRAGKIRSCGCLQRDEPSALKHGHSAGWKITPTYHSWAGMWARVTDPKHISWPYYGGCGVTICERWRSFEAFLADMGEKPRGTSIDRVDPFGNYEPGNCRWATPKEQMQNRRKCPAFLR